MELVEYAKEGIDGAKITYDDNQPLLDLMLEKRGLISILDEEVRRGRACGEHGEHTFAASAIFLPSASSSTVNPTPPTPTPFPEPLSAGVRFLLCPQAA
jgi:hypothetical protein